MRPTTQKPTTTTQMPTTAESTVKTTTTAKTTTTTTAPPDSPEEVEESQPESVENMGVPLEANPETLGENPLAEDDSSRVDCTGRMFVPHKRCDLVSG